MRQRSERRESESNKKREKQYFNLWVLSQLIPMIIIEDSFCGSRPCSGMFI